MQRLVQDQFECHGGTLQVALELNTLDAFRGVVRQGEWVALLPQSALLEMGADPALAIRSSADPVLTRRVVLVTTRDRLTIPPLLHLSQLVHQQIDHRFPPPEPRPHESSLPRTAEKSR
jgi:DNA-binding transcriptional LysR family regulator